MDNLAVLDAPPTTAQTAQTAQTAMAAQSARGATVDEATMTLLQEEHGRALLGFLVRLTFGDRQRAEDLVQETFVRAWRNPQILHTDHASMRPWLFTVARRLWIDARRGKLARPTEIGGDAIDCGRAAEDDDIERSIVVQDVRHAVRQLSDEHRAVLVEVYFRCRTIAEAAENLGIPVGTVKSRTYYALRCLRARLTGYDGTS